MTTKKEINARNKQMGEMSRHIDKYLDVFGFGSLLSEIVFVCRQKGHTKNIKWFDIADKFWKLVNIDWEEF